MRLTNPTDDELNAAFAEKVAGWKRIDKPEFQNGMEEMGWLGALGLRREFWDDEQLPRFTTSADAVLPWLETWPTVTICFGVDVYVEISETPGYMSCPPVINGCAVTLPRHSFPRAAVIALLRAHGVEIEFT